MTGATVPYVARRGSRSFRLSVRGIDYRVRRWGPECAPPLVLLHGGRDNAATFQFLVDAFEGDHHVLAPDWRGHGATGWAPGSYWLSDFLSDLDALLEALLPGGGLPIVGHSMGGNIASLFAAVRPERVTRLVTLDSLGNPIDRSPVRIADELADLLAEQRAGRTARRYESVAAMATRLMQANPRLEEARAAFLAEEAARPVAGGGFVWPHDPAFHQSLPTLHSAEEWGACWSRIRAPVLSLLSSDPRPEAATGHAGHVRQRAGYFADLAIRRVPDTGHNLHHDAPATVAPIIEAFLADDPSLAELLAVLPPVLDAEQAT